MVLLKIAEIRTLRTGATGVAIILGQHLLCLSNVMFFRGNPSIGA